MPGITALYSSYDQQVTIKHLIERVVHSFKNNLETQSIVPPIDSPSVALAGSFPKHFLRKKNYYSDDYGTVLFYGELYNNLGSLDEAEYAHQRLKQSGINALSDFNGPFALFFWINQERSLFAATDRLGRFPLFYAKTQNGYCITTDLHLVFSAGIISPSLNRESVIDLLTIGFPLGEKSYFENVQRATAGEYLFCHANGLEKKTYWRPVYTNSLSDPKSMVEVFAACNERAMTKRPGSVIALSGGWDSRATIAALAHRSKSFSVMTFGERESTDVTIALQISQQLHLNHELIPAETEFFDEFHRLANDVITLGSGHTTIDLAFQLFAFHRLAGRFPMLLDSAGCEFRRGIRSKIAAQNAKSFADIADFLLSMYSSGTWNRDIIDKGLYFQHEKSTRTRLTEWLESLSLSSYEDQIDAFSFYELWSRHYAFGYPLQTSIIACHMPYSDNEFYDLFLSADRSIRWSHKFHEAVIQTFQPGIQSIPISYGHVKVPYGEQFSRYIPMVYHRLISQVSDIPGMQWVQQFDNSKPFRPYHTWYVQQLEQYVREMFTNDSIRSSGFIDPDGIIRLLDKQKSSSRDLSHSISILLTLAHLSEYVRSINLQTTPRSRS